MDRIIAFWQFAIERGRTPSPVWVIVGPKGYIFGWSIIHDAAKQKMNLYRDHGTLNLVKMTLTD